MAGTLSTLDQFDELLNATTNDELLEFIVRAFEAGADRVDNYYADEGDEAPPLDLVNEGLVFVDRLDALVPNICENERADKVWYRLYNAKKWLLEDRDRAAAGRPPSARPHRRSPRPQTSVSSARPAAPPLQLDDEHAVLAAVAEADRQRDERFASMGRERHDDDGVAAREVARVLAGELTPAHGDVIRVGLLLGRLAREGQLRVVSKTYEHGARRYSPAGGRDA